MSLSAAHYTLGIAYGMDCVALRSQLDAVDEVVDAGHEAVGVVCGEE